MDSEKINVARKQSVKQTEKERNEKLSKLVKEFDQKQKLKEAPAEADDDFNLSEGCIKVA